MIVRTFFDDGGQGLAEYALIAAFVAVLCISAVALLGSRLVGQYQSISSNYP